MFRAYSIVPLVPFKRLGPERRVVVGLESVLEVLLEEAPELRLARAAGSARARVRCASGGGGGGGTRRGGAGSGSGRGEDGEVVEQEREEARQALVQAPHQHTQAELVHLEHEVQTRLRRRVRRRRHQLIHHVRQQVKQEVTA